MWLRTKTSFQEGLGLQTSLEYTNISRGRSYQPSTYHRARVPRSLRALHFPVKKKQRQQQQPTKIMWFHLSGGIVLGPVARADELVLGLVPRHHASQVSAYSHDPVVLDLLVLRHHQVRCVTLRSERACVLSVQKIKQRRKEDKTRQKRQRQKKKRKKFGNFEPKVLRTR